MAGQEVMACRKHDFVLARFGRVDRSLFRPSELEGLPRSEVLCRRSRRQLPHMNHLNIISETQTEKNPLPFYQDLV